MKRFFLDTSALVKIYHREVGTDYCLELYSSHAHLIISELARVELYSAILRKQREKQLDAKVLKAVLLKFMNDCEERYEVLQAASLVYDEACGLLSRYTPLYGLRTLDSLQLATFLNYCEKEQDGFVCADKKLSDVVEREGIKTVFV